jgi:uncharacterized protein YutE (UPF0331/DUF86 family)
MDDIAINKAEIIRRCIRRIDEEFRGDLSRLEDWTIQDSVILNLLRACEASIDLARHQVALGRLGIPQNSRDAFELLANHNIISHECGETMKHMVGFRNIAVHDYQRLQTEILNSILTKQLNDFELFLRALSV